MKATNVKVLIVIVFLLMISTTRADTLTILNWEDYLSEEVIEAWQQKSGHTIEQVFVDNDEERDSIILNHTDQVIDLVVLDETISHVLARRGIILPISSYKLKPDFAMADEAFNQQCGTHSIPYLWGTLGIAYRTDKISTPPTSWDFILNPQPKLQGHIGLLDDFTDMLVPSLLKQGYSVNTENPNELKKAFEQFKALLPSILTFEYGLSYAENEANRDKLYAALVYSGDQYSLNELYEDEIWEYTTLDEGTIAWVDCMAVMANSPRKEIAYDFLNYLYTPSVAAMNSETVYVASPIEQARQLQSEEFLNDETVYPAEHVLNKAQNYQQLSPENMLLRNRITSSLVKLHESQ